MSCCKVICGHSSQLVLWLLQKLQLYFTYKWSVTLIFLVHTFHTKCWGALLLSGRGSDRSWTTNLQASYSINNLHLTNEALALQLHLTHLSSNLGIPQLPISEAFSSPTTWITLSILEREVSRITIPRNHPDLTWTVSQSTSLTPHCIETHPASNPPPSPKKQGPQTCYPDLFGNEVLSYTHFSHPQSPRAGL